MYIENLLGGFKIILMARSNNKVCCNTNKKFSVDCFKTYKSPKTCNILLENDIHFIIQQLIFFKLFVTFSVRNNVLAWVTSWLTNSS